MEKKNKLRAGRICVGATINSLAATSAFVVIALLLYELTGKLNVPYSTLSVAYTFAYAGMMLASFFGGKIITRNGRLGPVISTSAALSAVSDLYEQRMAGVRCRACLRFWPGTYVLLHEYRDRIMVWRRPVDGARCGPGRNDRWRGSSNACCCFVA